jgi:ABC-type nickel/cobalt efflux system permease component RcnA
MVKSNYIALPFPTARARGSILLIIVLIMAAAPASAKAPVISWDALRPDSNIQFDDPFSRLRPDQLRDLRIIVRIRWLIANGKSAPNGVSAKEEQRLVKDLAYQGVDVDWLLSQREKVANERRKKLESTGAGVLGTAIRIPGYVMPLFPDQPEVRDFLLVPWVAPCAHFPPPSGNQVIHVTIEPGMAPRDRFDPVWIEGTLHRNPSEHTVYLVDGVIRMEAAYRLGGKFIAGYSAGESDVLAEGAMAAQNPDQSWYRNLQMQVTILFTQAMTAIRDRKSSGPVWFGLLLAFAYGALHTLGPGHGKAVVISYFVGHGGSLVKGIRMGTLIAVCHVLSAVVVVSLTSFAIRQITGHAPADFRIVRLISYAAIGGIGAFMLWRAIRDVWPKKQAPILKTIGQCNSEHNNHHHHGCCSCSSNLTHNDTPMGWLALAAGAVPCTGAILALLFGLSHDLLIPAVLMVMMMSLGMAIALSGIGILAILGRNFAEHRFIKNETTGQRFNKSLKVGAASLILLIGLTLFTLTMGEKVPFQTATARAGVSTAQN